jgi:hypothetical protein
MRLEDRHAAGAWPDILSAQSLSDTGERRCSIDADVAVTASAWLGGLRGATATGEEERDD